MFEQATMTAEDRDALLFLRKSIEDLTDEIKELNQKLPKSYEIENLVKSVHKLAQLADSK